MIAGKNVFLFLTDKASETVLHNLKALQAGTANFGETYVLYHQKGNDIPECYNNPQTFLFTERSLGEMGYLPIGYNLVPGSNHFPVLKFSFKYPGYDYYWVIEDDVWFNGDWSDFFAFFHSFDHHFLSSHIRFYEQEPDWNWWVTFLHPLGTIPLKYLVRSFNPIYRLSRPALEFVHRSLGDFWMGHHEVLFPSLLYHNGFRIGDFGGEGAFVVKGNTNRFYTSGTATDSEGQLSNGTMRYKPSWEKNGMLPNMLYHPVKGLLNEKLM